MVYEALCHLSSLYAAGLEASKANRHHAALTDISNSVLDCLSVVVEAGKSTHKDPRQDKLVKKMTAFIKRCDQVGKCINMWTDNFRIVGLILKLERRWQMILSTDEFLEQALGEKLIRQSKQRCKALRDLYKYIEEEANDITSRYAIPTAL